MIPRKVRGVVEARDEYRCVSCGRYATDLHHRRFKGMGGSRLPDKDSAANLVTLCGAGNTSGCHGRAHNDRPWAEGNGFRLPQGSDPRETPITHLLWGPVYLTPEGNFSTLAPNQQETPC